jgi:hypothetical protein
MAPEVAMVRVVAGIALLVAGMLGPVRAQERNFTVTVKGNLTSESTLYTSVKQAASEAREAAVAFENLYGFGVEVKYLFPGSRIALGLGAEYISTRLDTPLKVSFANSIPSSDGYSIIPVELTGYFIIPASGRSVKIFMGGGAGVYVGHRNYSVAGIDAITERSSVGAGIHVLAGVNYFLTDRISLLAEMKFRDAKFESTTRFPGDRIVYQGLLIPVGSVPSQVRVQTDGIVFQIGAGYSF